MKVLMINGSPNAKGCTYTALMEVAKEFEQSGIDYEVLQIGKSPVRGCIACHGCSKSGEGHCVFNDDIANQIIDKINEADAVIVGSPVYYAGISGQIKSILDRVFFAGRGFSNKLAASVVSCRRGGASAAFDQLNHYFLKGNMHVVSSQYWNQVHGNNAEEVAQDLEGLQTMRTLGKNMSWLLKCIEVGNQKGIENPEYGAWIPTNFIR